MKAVLWDFDGTLADTEVVWGRVQGRFVERHGGSWTTETAHALVGTSMAETADVIAGLLPGRPLTPEAIAAGIELDMIEAFSAGPLPLRPGVAELLAEMVRLDIPSALVSASPRALLRVALSWLGEHPFRFVIGGEDVSRPKPDPEGYLSALRRLGVGAGDAVIVEDSVSGTQAANATGALVVAVPDQVPIGEAPRRVVLPTLAGVGIDELHRLWEEHR
ncbi:MAG: HAD family phosphatase [Propionibacteriaceae bacterium]|nr:HAD family phosphatase [Propionibacteriaceae bacterium]